MDTNFIFFFGSYNNWNLGYFSRAKIVLKEKIIKHTKQIYITLLTGVHNFFLVIGLDNFYYQFMDIGVPSHLYSYFRFIFLK